MDKNVQVLWKQNQGTNRPTFTRSWSCPSSEDQSTRSTKKGSGSSQAAPPINPEGLALLLKTHLRRGKISYDEKNVEERVERWTAPQKMADQLLVRWQSTDNAELGISLNTKTGDQDIVVKGDENNTVKTVKDTMQSSFPAVYSFTWN